MQIRVGAKTIAPPVFLDYTLGIPIIFTKRNRLPAFY